MDHDTQDILEALTGCALVVALFIVGTIWGIVAALKWAFA